MLNLLLKNSSNVDEWMLRPMLYWTGGIKNKTHFFCRWALTLTPRFDKEATSALWLTSLGAPPDCRNGPDLAGRGVRQVGSSGGHNR